MGEFGGCRAAKRKERKERKIKLRVLFGLKSLWACACVFGPTREKRKKIIVVRFGL